MAGDSFGQAASGAGGITRQSERILDTGATIRHNRDVGPQKLGQDLVGGGTFHIDLFARDLFLTSSSGNLPGIATGDTITGSYARSFRLLCYP